MTADRTLKRIYYWQFNYQTPGVIFTSISTLLFKSLTGIFTVKTLPAEKAVIAELGESQLSFVKTHAYCTCNRIMQRGTPLVEDYILKRGQV
jgi:hypothetical protein